MPMPYEVMIASHKDRVPVNGDHLCEVKWDGIRALWVVNKNKVEIWSRRKNNITAKFPELTGNLPFTCKSGVFDSEIVCFKKDGRPSFRKVMGRLANKKANAESAARKSPARVMLFDCLSLEGEEMIDQPLVKRKKVLEKAVQANNYFSLSESFEDGVALYEGIKAQDLEGLVAKLSQSFYFPGKKSGAWVKVKNRKTIECVITGYNQGEGERVDTFSSIIVAAIEGKELVKRGSVGSGFNQFTLLQMRQIMDLIIEEIKGKKVMITPKIVCEIEYAEIDSDGSFRAPVFKRLVGQWDGGGE